MIFTARGMETCDGNVDQVIDSYKQLTVQWLEDNRVCYNKLVFGKLSAEYYVDDKGLSPKQFIEKKII